MPGTPVEALLHRVLSGVSDIYEMASNRYFPFPPAMGLNSQRTKALELFAMKAGIYHVNRSENGIVQQFQKKNTRNEERPNMFVRSAANLMNAVALLLGAGLVAAAAPRPAQSVKDVKVVNTPNVNVTNTPSVHVATMPAVTGSVAVTNTPTVNVGNTPSVNVANTGTQPVPSVRIDEPGRIPYQSQVSKSDGFCTGATRCLFPFGSVPAGHRLVIQHISGIITGGGATVVQLNNGSGLPVSAFFAAQARDVALNAFDKTVQAYFDPAAFGGVIEVQVHLLGGATLPAVGQVEVITLSGYELDCSVAACAPIAH